MFSSIDDGKILYVTELFSLSLTQGVISVRTLGILDIKTKQLNSDVNEIKVLLKANGTIVLEMRPHVKRIILYTEVEGYFLLLDDDGYKALSKYIVN